jgi:hypothetical protein
MEYVLFKNWIPSDALQYWSTILALILFAILFELLIAYHTVIEATKWGLGIGATVYPYTISGNHDLRGAYRVAAMRFTSKFTTSTLGYALMLVTV